MVRPKLHASTIVFLVLVAIGLLLANIPGQILLAPNMNRTGTFGPHFGLDATCHHGWPATFLIREPVNSPASPLQRLSLWRLSEGVVRWSWWHLAANILVGLVLFTAACGSFELWRRRRGRFQVRLIDVLAICTLVACGFSYWRTLANERNRQENVIAQLQAVGATSPQDEDWSEGGPSWLREWSYEWPSWLREWIRDQPFAAGERVIGIRIRAKGFTDLPQLRSLKVVRLTNITVSTDQLNALRELPELKVLDLSDCCRESDEEGADGFPRDDTVELPRLPHLQGLNLNNAAFYGDGLEWLRDIEVLDLGDTAIGDDAMPKFAAMRNLNSLSLMGTKITDAGLEHLKGLTQLRELRLGRGKLPNVTAEGIKRLQRALPNCKINKID